MAKWEFTVVLQGEGDTLEQAWDNAVEGFIQEPGAPDEENAVKLEEGE